MINIIIILGISNENHIYKRVDRAVEEYLSLNKEDENYILISGSGRANGYMFSHLIKKGIDKNKIINEPDSRTTIENLILSFNIIKNKFPIKPNVIICTQTFHIKRTMILSKFYNKDNLKIKFIHNNEKITKGQKESEFIKLITFFNYYQSSLFQIEKQSKNRNIIIVLGNSQKDIMIKRLNKAIETYHEIKNKQYYDDVDFFDYTYIMVSGCGKGLEKECDFMKSYLIEKGLEQEKILTEDKSMNTIENLNFCFEMIRKSYQNSISLFEVPNVYICTSSSHIIRSLIISEFLEPQFNLNYIHTYEKTTNENLQKEIESAYKFLDNYL